MVAPSEELELDDRSESLTYGVPARDVVLRRGCDRAVHHIAGKRPAVA